MGHRLPATDMPRADDIKKLKARVRALERETVEYQEIANLDYRIEEAMQIIADHLGVSLSELYEVRRRKDWRTKT